MYDSPEELLRHIRLGEDTSRPPGWQMCAVDDAARLNKNWVRLSTGGGPLPMIFSQQFEIWRAGGQ